MVRSTQTPVSDTWSHALGFIGTPGLTEPEPRRFRRFCVGPIVGYDGILVLFAPDDEQQLEAEQVNDNAHSSSPVTRGPGSVQPKNGEEDILKGRSTRAAIPTHADRADTVD